MNGLSSYLEPDYSEFVEVDPTTRYGRYNEILGKGASKTVYRAFDEYQGIEVAWNQVKLYDFLQSPEDLERLYCEIHLLKTLKHDHIMKFHTSWVDTANRNINFVTEMFTSGTLRQYRQKHKRVNIRAVKNWCRQILKGLLYLHSHDPPVIHRDLKCDNIFVNGNQGEVKIGDLGLAAMLRKSHAAHCVGTPEFMAPEVYEEAYNELVDIYSFGMCVLEMVTFEYPYSECNHPAQIYKKVVSGKKPDALYKVRDPEVRQFVEKCLATVSLRLSARELLNDHFLQIDDSESDLSPLDYGRERVDMDDPFIRQPYVEYRHNDNNSYSNGYSEGYAFEAQNEWDYHPVENEPSGIELFEHHEDEHSANLDISIKGKKGDDGSIFLRLRIADREGRIRNIYFPFDVDMDTALSVATEMVAELDIYDQDVTKIADMIDGEISSLVPGWRSVPRMDESLRFCQNCASTRTSTGSLVEFLSNNPGALQCCTHGCASMRGRFGEITFVALDQDESRQLSSAGFEQSHSDEDYEKIPQSISPHDETETNEENQTISCERNSLIGSSRRSRHSRRPSFHCDISFSDNHEDEIQQELRWLKAKYQKELRQLRDKELGLATTKSPARIFSSPSSSSPLKGEKNTKCSGPDEHFAHHIYDEHDNVYAAKSFDRDSLVPQSLHRTGSLPVDAISM